MQFDKILAHEPIKNKLKNLVRNNRLSHALLFLGKEGSGALPLAVAFAQYILCEKVNSNQGDKNEVPLFVEQEIVKNRSIDFDDSCGQCNSCKKINQLIHPDVHFSYPALKKDSRHDRVLSTDYITEWREFINQFPYNNVTDWINFLKENSKSKIENPVNKQGNITVFECDDISHKLSLKSFESNYKILILWMPEYLGKEGNKLLKLIEEPPADTLFIMVAENEESILPTILSRTQLIKIPSFENEQVKTALINDYNIDSIKASQIAAVSQGNFREALQLLQNPEEDLQSQVRDWLNIIVKNKVSFQIKWIEEISRIGREKQKAFLKYFIHLLEQAVRSSYLSEESFQNIAGNELDFSVRLNKICTFEAQVALIEELEKAVYFIERNAHAKMLFHSLTIRFFHIIKDNSVILVH